jgi:aspartyl-tRNA(Asn)/glutamyl-tRNA(Gln) amidotransferase subunit A
VKATLEQLATDLAESRISSRALVEHCLAAIQHPDGEGSRTFLQVDAAGSLAAADFHDGQRRRNMHSRFAGIPISIKDLFDVAGAVTTAGSKLLANAVPAAADAPSVARLRAAGFIPIGRTNMTEFAFSGLGLNVHYSTPANPADRIVERIPGGSSSGAGVSVAAQMAYAALGTDTGGSCRIPAALCGVVGFKPTARRVPLRGAFPLAPSLDSIGPLANSVKCCASIDAFLADEPDEPLPRLDLRGVRFAVPQSYVLDGMDETVAKAFSRTLGVLSAHGATLEEIPLRELLELPELHHKGGIAPAEAYAIHREWITTRAAAYDPRVMTRILRGKEQDAADYIQLLRARSDFTRRVTAILTHYSALLLPTVPVVAPAMAPLQDNDVYLSTNAQLLRNPSIINFIDGCAISIPCQSPGELPVGLMLAAEHGADRRVLSIAAAVENVLAFRA